MFLGELAQGISVLYQFIIIDKILKILHSDCENSGWKAVEAISKIGVLFKTQIWFAFRFTPGAGLQAEKKMGPSAADVEAIKVWNC